jgi:hypothetical protein
MDTKRSLILTLSLIFVLACSISMGAKPTAIPPVAPPPAQVPLPTYTPYPTYTVEAPPLVQPTIPPTAQATPFPLAQTQWNGTFRWFGSLNPVSFIIQKVNGSSFTGAMYWTFDICKVTERTEGDIIYDITTATEQNRWALHPDFQSGDKVGTWLRWTQNESIGATKCYLTISGDWWYAHISSNGHMTGIHFTNSTNTVPDADATFDFTKVSP